MISPRALDSIERIFYRAAASRLTRAPEDSCVVARDHPGPADAEGAQAVLLTISSIVFRLVLVLRFDDDEATRAYFCGAASECDLREAVLETGNLCCGAINQELLRHFPDLGMSTPYALDARCLGYIDQLKPSHVASYTVTIDDTVRLAATLCICTSAPLDFVADFAVVEESCGELELF